MTCQQNGSTVGICVPYSFNTSTNQISNTGYVYGGTGHLINDGTHTYQYDAEGRLISVDNGTTATYLYDALGQRVEKDVGGVYSEYVFNLQGQPVGIHNRTNWQEDYIPLGQGRHVAHYAAGISPQVLPPACPDRNALLFCETQALGTGAGSLASDADASSPVAGAEFQFVPLEASLHFPEDVNRAKWLLVIGASLSLWLWQSLVLIKYMI